MKDLGLEGLGRELGLLIFSVLGVLACLLGEGVRVAWVEGGREGGCWGGIYWGMG